MHANSYIQSLIQTKEQEISELKDEKWLSARISNLEKEIERLKGLPKDAPYDDIFLEMKDIPKPPLKMGEPPRLGCCGRAKKLPATEAGNESPQLNNSQ